MTAKELLALSDAELAERSALEVMGWTKRVDNSLPGFPRLYWTDRDGNIVTTGILWQPGTDHNSAALIRAEIERRGLRHWFQAEIHDLLRVEDYVTDRSNYWAVMNASPRIQAVAALLAVRSAKA